MRRAAPVELLVLHIVPAAALAKAELMERKAREQMIEESLEGQSLS